MLLRSLSKSEVTVLLLSRRLTPSPVIKRGLSSSSPKNDLLLELKERGLISQISEPQDVLRSKLSSGDRLKLYCGVDPTAPSIHLGNLVPMMLMLNFYVRGHDVISVVGGATGAVGDPSGRTTERKKMKDEVRLDNVARISRQLNTFFQNGLAYYRRKLRSQLSDNGSNLSGTAQFGTYVQMNNYTWWRDVKMIDFLATYGSYIRITSMLSRESVTARLEKGANGLGFNEFTYQILQAYDFYHLYSKHNTTVQIGGNDQWGNITAGIDLINRLARSEKDTDQTDNSVASDKRCPPFGITVPLLTTSSGAKFGKSAGNAIFLDEEINTAYDIYQFFYNTSDEDVERFLKIFTLLPLNEIKAVMSEHLTAPYKHIGQRLLAKEVTELIHGPQSAVDAEVVSRIIFGEELPASYTEPKTGPALVQLLDKARVLQTVQGSDVKNLAGLIAELLQSSRADAKRRLSQGSVYLGLEEKVRIKENLSVNELQNYFICGTNVLLLRLGKQQCYVVQIR